MSQTPRIFHELLQVATGGPRYLILLLFSIGGKKYIKKYITKFELVINVFYTEVSGEKKESEQRK